MTTPDSCPCGSGSLLPECCGPFLNRTAKPATAEQLMRSRYSAFSVGDADYLRWSWHPDDCPDAIRLSPTRRWCGLRIESTERGGALDAEGYVTFVATSIDEGAGDQGTHELRERSRFTQHEGRWVYCHGVAT